MQWTVAPSALRSPSQLFWIRLILIGFFRRSGMSLLLARTWLRSSQPDRWVQRNVADGARSLGFGRGLFIRSKCRSPSKPAVHARENRANSPTPLSPSVVASFQLPSPCGRKFPTCLSPWPHLSNFPLLWVQVFNLPLPVAAPFQLPSLVGASFQLAHAFDKMKSCRRTAGFNRWAGRQPGRHD